MTTGEEETNEKKNKEALKMILVAAYEEYSQNGVSKTRCPGCLGIIEFKPMNETTLEVRCPCGLMNDTLKGL